MITNVPKETMAFQGFPYEKPEDTFIGPEDVLNYIKNFAKHFDLEHYIRFFTQVVFVTPIENAKWLVKTKNVKTGDIQETVFDAVVVCNGHFFKPFIPDIPGSHLLKAIHSREYRRAEKYKNKTVLIIGAGRSGTDISRLLAPEAKKVIVSFTGKPFCSLDKRVQPKPFHVKYFTESKVIFDDASEEFVDIVIFCTGYRTAFPFLSINCNISVQENWVKPLYKHLINIEHPTMAIINITDFTLTFPLSELQTRFFLSLLKNKFLVTKEEMIKDYKRVIEEREIQGIPLKYTHTLGAERMEEYCRDLSTTGRVPNIPQVINEIHKYRYSLNRSSKIKIINEEEFLVTG